MRVTAGGAYPPPPGPSRPGFVILPRSRTLFSSFSPTPLARAGRPDSIRRLELAGATRTISPYVMAGHRMAELAIRPAMVDLLDTLHRGEAGIGVEEMVVSPGTNAIQKTLDEAGLLAPEAARVLAVRKSDGTLNVNPQPGTRLDDGDLVIALGTEDQLFASASKLR